MARGASAKVFDKRASDYPLKFLMDQGQLVKVICKSNPREAKLTFWEMKLAHAMFPENTPNPRAMRYNRGIFRGLTEIHMDPVPVHAELTDYQNHLASRQHYGHDKTSPHWEAAKEAYANRGGTAHKVALEMMEAGINTDMFMGNPTNVSLHDPQKPVFFEPQVIGMDNLRDWAFRVDRKALRDLAESKHEQLDRYIRTRLDPGRMPDAQRYLNRWWGIVQEQIPK